MDFFGAQQKAQQQTKQAIGLFSFAVAATIFAVYAAFSGILLLCYNQLGLEIIPSNPNPTTIPEAMLGVVILLLTLNIGFLLNALNSSQKSHRNSIAGTLLNFAIGFFAAGVVGYILKTNIADTPWIQQLFGDNWLEAKFWEPQRFFWTIFITVSVVLNASLIRLNKIMGGSKNILNLMNAREVDPSGSTGKERVLMNVIEEMAIASGHPIPTVAIMPEKSINAFAIGANTNDCAIVVTQGLLEGFSRDELQAVIGHEFSHLLNGDSKINMRMHGWIYGLLAISAVGKGVMRGTFGGRHRRSRSSNSGSGGGFIVIAIFLFALCLILIGAIGFIVGRIIQAMISRQREYLADASAVQFTRNPDAMVKALGRIKQGTSNITHPQASGFAHCFFANSSQFELFSSLTATHPALEKRMGAINPQYEGIIADLKPVEQPKEQPKHKRGANKDGSRLVGMATMIAAAGGLTAQQLESVKDFSEGIDISVKEALETPEGSINLILAGALDEDSTLRHGQLKMLEPRLGLETIGQISTLYKEIEKQADNAFIPTAQLALARIKPLEAEVKEGVCQLLEDLIAYDDQLTLQEAFYAEFVAFCLEVSKNYQALPANVAASQVLSRLVDEQGIQDSQGGFEKATEGLVLQKVRYTPQTPSAEVRSSLPALRGLPFIQRRELLIAAGRAVKLDGELDAKEAEYLRALAILMGCALPANLS